MIFVGILLFILLVVVHELGHMLAAKKNGVIVEEFGIGFPPRVIGRRFKKDGTLYSLNWLPLGGFIKLKGEHDSDTEPGSYGAASFGRKALILLAGVGMNLVAAWFILTILSWTGVQQLVPNQFTVSSDTTYVKDDVLVGYVADESAAEEAGLQAGDALLSVGEQPIEEASQIAPLAESLAGESREVTFSRNGNVESTVVNFDEERGDTGYFGVDVGDDIVERSTWSAPIKGLVLTGQFSWLTLEGLLSTLGSLFQGQGAAAAENVAGPVGVVVLLNSVSQAGFGLLLFFIALISITLAVVNVLPIPALDGGRLFVSGLFRALHKPLDAKLEERIHAAGMAALLVLIALITVVDVNRFL